jgi:hypothetical protein
MKIRMQQVAEGMHGAQHQMQSMAMPIAMPMAVPMAMPIAMPMAMPMHTLKPQTQSPMTKMNPAVAALLLRAQSGTL